MELSNSVPALHAAILGRLADSAGLPGGPPLWRTGDIIAINPQTIAGSAQDLASSLLNNDAFIVQPAPVVFAQHGGVTGGAGTVGFHPATNLIPVQATQDASFASVRLHASDSTGTNVPLGGGAAIDLQGLLLPSLHAADFRFV